MTTSAEGALVAVFALVVTSFVAATAFSQYRAESIDGCARQIASEVAPVIEALTEVRTQMQEVSATSTRYAGIRSPAGITQVLKARDALREGERLFLAIPPSSSERRRWLDTVAPKLEDLQAATDRLMQDAASGNWEAAEATADHDLAAATERTSRAVAQILGDTATHGHDLAVRIEQTRERAAVVGWSLDILCTIAAVIGVALVVRIHRRHAALATAQSQLLHERNQELEEFAGRVAHDILSPLTTVGMSVSILRHKATDRPEFASLVARGERGLREVDAIVHGLLEFARAGARPGADSNTEIGPVLEDLLITWAPLAEQHHVRIDCEPPPPCNVGCNLGVLTSMLSNLVQNAIKYMGDSPTRRICIRVEDRSNRVRVEVQDTGPGMPSELAPRVFSPYVRGTGTGRPGIGLGLATVKRMAEAHGGCVGVHTALGQGSLFWFELPRATERAPATAVIAGREERSERPALI